MECNQIFDTGLELNLLQEFLYIPLDIFLENRHTIHTETDAWLSFLSMDDPKVILEIITKFPAFIPLYNDIFQFRRDIREVLNMFSKELEEMDRNTIRYMVEQQQDLIEKQKTELAEKEVALAAKDVEKEAALASKDVEKEAALASKDAEKEAALASKDAEKEAALASKDAEIKQLRIELAAQK